MPDHDDEDELTPEEPEWLADNDSPWKELIDAEFESFLRFFAAHAADDVDWRYEPVALDSELQALSIGAEHGRRYADKLVQVKRKNGDDILVLVHVEVQGQRDPHFAARMAAYRWRIQQQWGRPVFSMAVLVDDSPSWRPSEHTESLWGNRVEFTFHAVKLLDFASRIDELLRSDNVFGVAVAAHLRARASRKDPLRRFGWKVELTRLLLDRGESAERIQRLFRFIDWVLILPASLRVRYTQDMRQLRQERRVPYVTTVDRDDLDDARQQGMQQGMQQGQVALVLRLLARRIDGLDDDTRANIAALPSPRLEALTDALLDFHDADDVRRWLARR